MTKRDSDLANLAKANEVRMEQSRQRRERARTLRAQGVTPYYIAVRLGVSVKQVYTYLSTPG